MSKTFIKKSTINKVARLLFSPPKKRPVRKPVKARSKPKLEKVRYELVHIDGGSKIIFSPEGTQYAQDKLEELYDPTEKPRWFSVTPQNKYQKEHDWPAAPKFVNVNTPGSIETNRENWLGYIGAWEDDENQTYVVEHLLKILKKKRPLLKGKIIKESDGEYRIIFFVSHESIEKASKEAS